MIDCLPSQSSELSSRVFKFQKYLSLSSRDFNTTISIHNYSVINIFVVLYCVSFIENAYSGIVPIYL